MAIIQISRIQQRRGLNQDLPQLASAEFGWSVDTQQLYIGNGTLDEGALSEGVTEILTANSNILEQFSHYEFKGLLSGAAAVTSGTSTPIARTLQDKLDDFVNVLDFGAIGNGVDDDTAAINRALSNAIAYSSSLESATMRRAVYFPSGIYKISGTLVMPSFCTIIGDGKENTVIWQPSTNSTTMLKLADSNVQYGSSFGDAPENVATVGRGYTISNISIVGESSALESCVEIVGGDRALFSSVKFSGKIKADSDQGDSMALVKLSGTSSDIPSLGALFTNCDFTYHSRAANISGNSDNVIFDNCRFEHLVKDVVYSLGKNVSIRNAITVDVDSSLNRNLFDRNGTSVSSTGYYMEVEPSTSEVLPFTDEIGTFQTVTLEYTISRDGEKRVGVFKSVGNGSSYSTEDDYVESNNAGLGIDFSVNDDGMIVCSTSGVGGNADVMYTLKYHG